MCLQLGVMEGLPDNIEWPEPTMRRRVAELRLDPIRQQLERPTAESRTHVIPWAWEGVSTGGSRPIPLAI